MCPRAVDGVDRVSDGRRGVHRESGGGAVSTAHEERLQPGVNVGRHLTSKIGRIHGEVGVVGHGADALLTDARDAQAFVD